MSLEPFPAVSAVVLGIMQDGGLPHAGCRCPRCADAYEQPALAGYAACLALVDARALPARVWLIDATPDIKWQLNDLRGILGPRPGRVERLRPPDGILLTHGHMGHVGGLPQFGPEAMAADGLPVYASEALAGVIRESAIWRPAASTLSWATLTAGRPVTLGYSLTVTPLAVPHRDEWGAGTFAFLVEGPARSLLYVPDIDRWEDWPAARAVVGAVDVALVDATFYSAAELGGRPPVAHPLIPDTLAYFGESAGKLVLTHLNHTNPVLDEDSEERAMVYRRGATVARQGQVFSLINT
ncbi:MAG: MBL fold metallo-hydrolase [Anaerolineae bacterium]|uniref:MBL fold metallo-hydrolase n=1 Tax=Promineifilum sp. TaxID=2664178 RepID=UPI001E0C1394|nr:MBL fold metallo-hydrolase [Anaerolineales bacterium]MCB8933946.1 MBL fold metallo-hydrolase [Promineifilum sp.]MCO5179347.1 MBL fold metallo-hydrolase [Promineifilum sp.]MCW5845939.1 MBL fold metallo-hydrolase [Anaerolineae bacterium]